MRIYGAKENESFLNSIWTLYWYCYPQCVYSR